LEAALAKQMLHPSAGGRARTALVRAGGIWSSIQSLVSDPGAATQRRPLR
jgi:hypothetical protein